MKKMLAFFALLAGSTACQQSLPTQKEAELPTRTVAVKLISRKNISTTYQLPPPLPVWHGRLTRDSLPSWPVTDSMVVHTFFKRHDVSALLLAGTEEQLYPLEGFRGANKYRTEVVVLHAQRNPTAPTSYRLHGLSRTHHHISGFAGQVTFIALTELPLVTTEERTTVNDFSMVTIIPQGGEAVKRYALVGRVALTESTGHTAIAAFRGDLILEVALNKKGQLREDVPFLHGPSQGGGQKYEGTWTSTRTGQQEPAVWVASIVGYGPNIFSDLILGERDVAINPEYAHLGWNEMWQNDEWWADYIKPHSNR